MGALLARFGDAGVTFRTLPGGQLHAAGALDDGTRAEIREHKAAILSELNAADASWLGDGRGLRNRGVTGDIERQRVGYASSTRACVREGLDIELRRLVALLFGDDTEAHQAEALAAARADPEAALTSFRLLAADATKRAHDEALFGRT